MAHISAGVKFFRPAHVRWRGFAALGDRTVCGRRSIMSMSTAKKNVAPVERTMLRRIGGEKNGIATEAVVGMTAIGATATVAQRWQKWTRCEQSLESMKVEIATEEKHEIGRDETGGLWRLVDKIKNAWSNLVRMLQLAGIFFPCLLTVPFWYIIPVPKEYEDWWLNLVVYCVQHAGPMFIKMGQWASTRADLFSKRLRNALRQLHDQCFYESWSQTQKTIEMSLNGKPLQEVFETFEKDPIGAGCIAQVHKARMRDDGQWVAVKVQRNRVRRLIERDLALMNNAVWLLNSCLPSSIVDLMGLKDSADLFSGFMTSQLDFRLEAENLKLFRRNFEGSSLAVRFPEPLLVSPNGQLLVETLEEGIPLTNLMEDGGCSDRLRRAIGSIGVRAFLKMVLIDNFCHSDLHPGNMLVRLEHGGSPHDPNVKLAGVTLIDVGLTTTLSEQNQRNFVDLFAAVATGNGKLAGTLMIERQDPAKLTRCVNPEGFIDGIENVVSKVKFDSFRLDKVQIGNVLEQVLSLVHEYKVPTDPSFTNIVLSIIVLEGLGRQLDPTLDIFKESLPLLYQLDKSWRIAAFQALRNHIPFAK